MPRFIDIDGSVSLEAAAAARAAIQLGNGFDIVNVKHYGAVGDGTADDTAEIEAAWTAAGSNSVIYFPPGNYVYNGTGLSSNNPRIVGAAHEATTITLGASSYLINSNVYFYSLLLRDIKTVGGKGAIKHTFSSINVSGQMLIQNCRFEEYTECAIASDAADMPYWHIRDCLFNAANSTGTIGVALASGTDLCVIDSCSFIKNRIHLKARVGNALQITRSDFIQFSNVNSSGPRVAVWITPEATATNAGAGLNISTCKFGNENLLAGDYRILYADELSGSSNGVRFPNLAADSSNFVRGHTITNNLIAGNSTGTHPIIYSTVSDVRDLQMSGNVLSGNQPNYAVEFRTAPTTPNRLTSSNIVGRFTGQISTESIPFPVSNAVGFACVDDPQGIQQQPDSIRNWLSGSSASYREVLSASITSAIVTSPATRSTITDSYGGSDAITLTFSTSTTAMAYLGLSAFTVGMPVWIEFDVANTNDGNNVGNFQVFVRDSNSFYHWRRYVEVPSVDKGWVTYAFSFTPRTVGTSHSIFFAATNADASGKTAKIGRVRVYHGNERQVGGRRSAAAAAATTAVGTIDAVNDLRNNLIAVGLLSGTPSSGSATALGTPASGTLTNCTGLPQAGVVNLSTDLARVRDLTAGMRDAIDNLASDPDGSRAGLWGTDNVCTTEISTTQKISGTQSVKLTLTGTGNPYFFLIRGPSGEFSGYTPLQVAPTEVFSVSCWVRADASNGNIKNCRMLAFATDSTGVTTAATTFGSEVTPTTAGWTQVTATFTIGSGLDRVNFALYFASGGTTGTSYFVDNMVVRRLWTPAEQGVGSLQLGHVTDTTLSRSSAGVLAVEGVPVSLNATTATHTAQQIELGHATDTTVSRTSGGQIAVEGNPVGIKVAVPASSSATGVVGQWAAESGWLYICTAANTWQRTALTASWP